MSPSSIVITEENAQLFQKWVGGLQEAGFGGSAMVALGQPGKCDPPLFQSPDLDANRGLLGDLRALHIPEIRSGGVGSEVNSINVLPAGCAVYLCPRIRKQGLVPAVSLLCIQRWRSNRTRPKHAPTVTTRLNFDWFDFRQSEGGR